MKKIILFSLILFFGNQALSQTKTWTGANSASWNVPGNWNPAGVPTETNDVTIPAAPENQPTLSVNNAVAKSVEVQSGATFNIASTGVLTINSSKGFTVAAQTWILAFLNRGTVENSGSIVLGNTAPVGQAGLFNTGEFNNNAGGEITIDRSTVVGLYNFLGTFTNVSKITIGGIENVGSVGLDNIGVFNNNTGGEITVDRSSTRGLFNNPFSTFTNIAKITIGAIASVGSDGLVNSGIFNNNTGGEIAIDRSSETGLLNSRTFTNESKITIGAIANVGFWGLDNHATFNNYTGGEIAIDRSSSRGLYNRSGTFTNAAKITIGANTSVGNLGLENTAIFYNNTGGDIAIDNSSSTGLFNSQNGTFTNVAKITIGANARVGNYGLENRGTFKNNTGGEIAIDRSSSRGLYNESGIFTNAAKITIGAIASVGRDGLENDATFNNNTGGEIAIDRSSEVGLSNYSGTFTNASKITIGANAIVGSIGLRNEDTFNNNACGKVQVLLGSLTLFDTYTNNGYTFVANNLRNFATFNNNGVLKYGSKVSSAIVNATTSSVIVNDSPTPIFTYGGTYDGTVNGIFTDNEATESAGAFTAPNTFISNSSLPSGIQTLYAKLTPVEGTCTFIVPFEYIPCNISADNVTDPTICNRTDGSIHFTTNLADGTYSLSFTTTGTSSPQNVTVSSGSFTLNGLSAGTYSDFSITNNGCTGSDARVKTLTYQPGAFAAATNATCEGTANNDGKITVYNFTPGDQYQYSTGTTFNAARATAIMDIPTDGVIVNDLPNAIRSYTVRISNANGCSIDHVVYLFESSCCINHAFQEDFKDGSGGVNNLDGATGVAVSPDGKQVYVASLLDDAFTVFDRNVLTGDLTFKQDFKDGTGDVNNLNGARGVAVSPDGKQVYVISSIDGALTVFDRNGLTGGLSFKQNFKDGVGRVNNLEGAWGVAVSPDGKQVYVTAQTDDALTIFDRDVLTGDFTFKQDFKDGNSLVDNLRGAAGVSVSPDGKQVYVVSRSDDALTVFDRNLLTGDLTFKQDFKDGNGLVDNLRGAAGVSVSPDGKQVYVVARNDDALTVFDRDAGTGDLTFKEDFKNGSGEVNNLDGATGVSISPDGKNVYVVSENDDALTIFDRNADTGDLTFKKGFKDGTRGANNLNGAIGVTVSPDGKNVYVNSLFDDALTVFDRQASANAGTPTNIAVCDNETTAINLFEQIAGEDAGGTWSRKSGTGGTFVAETGTFTPEVGASTSTFSYTVSGCPDATADVVVTLNASSFTAGTAVNPITCGGTEGSIPFTTNLGDGTYSLSFTSTGTSSPQNVTVSSGAFTLNGLSAGTYSDFSITNNGCTGTDLNSQVLNDPPTPVVSASFVSPFCQGSSLELTSSVSGITATAVYDWSGPGGFSSSDPNPVVTSPVNGIYNLTVTAAGCTSTAATPAISPIPLISLTNRIPSAFNDIFGCENGLTTIGLNIENAAEYTFQWQQSTGGAFTDLSESTPYSQVTNDTLEINPTSALMDGYQYRALISNACQTVISDTFNLRVGATPMITLQPVSQIVCPTNEAILEVAVNGAGVSFQWQIDNGSGFENVNGPEYVGANSKKLIISNFDFAKSGKAFRCLVFTSCFQIPSDPATITINTDVTILAQPMSQTVCEFGTAIFTAQAVKLSAGTLTYQWQRKAGTGNWIDVNTGGRYVVNGNQLQITNAPASWNGAEFRCLMNDYCQTIPKTLSVIPVAHVTQNPVNQEICVGNNANFSVSAAGEGLMYRWQVNSGSGFVNLTDGGIYQGVTSANLSLSFPSATVNNYQYRCVVSGTSTCDLVADTSAVASVSIGVSAEAQTVFYNSPINTDDGVTQAVGYILGINDIIAPNGKAEFRAGNAIILNPGFEVQAGAVFKAKIQNPCQTVSTSFEGGGSKIPKEKVK